VTGSPRIVVDASMVSVGGGCTFTSHLAPSLARQHPEARFLVLVRNSLLANAVPWLPNLEVRRLPPAGPARRLGFLAVEGRRIARAFRADLWFSVSESLPERLPCPSIACFQNPNLWTELRVPWPWSQRVRLVALRRAARRSARRAARVLFLSEDSRRWMGRATGTPEERRGVLPCGVEPDEWHLERRPPTHILSVGSAYPYKNQAKLIEAWALLAAAEPDAPELRIVGRGVDAATVRNLRAARAATGALAPKVHLHDWVSDAELRKLSAEAAMLVFPSYLETFGIPLLEAMAGGLPLVAADIPVFREVAGEAALYADPHSARDLAHAMRACLRDAAATRERVAAGLVRARRYTWEASARSLLDVFEAVLATEGRDLRRTEAVPRRRAVAP
jgi:glycosyltransferase involved in cell wall biosynthesis